MVWSTLDRTVCVPLNVGVGPRGGVSTVLPMLIGAVFTSCPLWNALIWCVLPSALATHESCTL